MARKSRKNLSKRDITVVQKWKNLAGIYVRLSVEDNNNSSDSLQNQIVFLKEYIDRNEDEFQFAGQYVDNGTTGTNFKRDGWQRMISDIKAGRIDCIIVKDFSRIGRNYIEVGNYMEKIFPFLGVRVVSVNDGFDSGKQSFETSMLMNSLKNIVNEYYARDISKKVRQAKQIMQKNGEYTSGIYPYGYKQSEIYKRKMDVDHEAAVVVKKIFEWRVCGKSCSQIANYLNELAVLSPGQYRFVNGNQAFRKCQSSKWKAEQVASILTNPVYLGHMVQGKKRISHFTNNGKAQNLPVEEWNIVKDTHEAVITQQQFDTARNMAEESHRKYRERMNANTDIPHIENPLRKKIFCGQCGRKMFRRSKVETGVRNYYYYCDSKRRKISGQCSQSYFHETVLMEIVRKSAEMHLKLLGDVCSKSKRQLYIEKNGGKEVNVQQREKLERKIQLVKRKKREIYEDMKEGILEKEDYELEKDRLQLRIHQCEEEIAHLSYDVVETLKEYPDYIFKLEGENIPLELLDEIVGKIIIVSRTQIEIAYTYGDLIKKQFV